MSYSAKVVHERTGKDGHAMIMASRNEFGFGQSKRRTTED